MAKLELSDSSQLRIGIKQSSKAIAEGRVKILYIAKDADMALVDELVQAAKNTNTPIVYAESMKELGRACKIDVGAATAVVLK